jgi:hypothetical protein
MENKYLEHEFKEGYMEEAFEHEPKMNKNPIVKLCDKKNMKGGINGRKK